MVHAKFVTNVTLSLSFAVLVRARLKVYGSDGAGNGLTKEINGEAEEDIIRKNMWLSPEMVRCHWSTLK